MLNIQKLHSFFHQFALGDAAAKTTGAPTYETFWEARARQSFWLTHHIGYRVGAYFALVAFRLGLKPAHLSLLSLVTSLSACAAALSIQSHFWAGTVLLVGLLVGYCLDCADGPLARVTGRASLFGALLDKAIDFVSAIAIPVVLSTSVAPAGTTTQFALLLLVAIVPRTALMMTLWLKEAHTKGADREREDNRPRTRLWRMRRGFGNAADEIAYRALLAIAWGCGAFWSAIMIFGIFHLALLVGYFTVLLREFGPDAPKPQATDA